MSLKKDYHQHSKLRGGPGDWHCPCCNPYDTNPRKMKPLARRLARRVKKMALKLIGLDY